MFTSEPCAAGCGRPAISGSKICAIHSTDAVAEARRIAVQIAQQEEVRDICAQGLHFDLADFSNRRFYGCNFIGTYFYRSVFTKSFMRMNFFDFANFIDCDFSQSNLKFLSFAGATIQNCTFQGSELTLINYGGTIISDATFNDSNLYCSRFIDADIEKTNFINCNLKRSFFISAKLDQVSFKASNQAEAIFDLKEIYK
ncbi:pentapeptide repeat-containing protein [Breznakiellaceae bacterium SP9]